MADAIAQRIWNIALGQLQIRIARPNYDTWPRESRDLPVESRNFVVGRLKDSVRYWPATQMRGSTLTFYRAEESEQQGPNFRRWLVIRPLDGFGLQC
jgi:hypothetical protein